MKIDDTTRWLLITESANDPSKEAFVSDYSLSELFGEDSDPSENAKICESAWEATHITIKEIRNHLGISQGEFSKKYFIPKRTIENWESGVRECPLYLRILLAKDSGAISDFT